MTHHFSRPARQFPVVRQCMTSSPLTVAPGSSLAAARRTMLEHHVRHLPALASGRIVGLLSERDLLLVESLPGVIPASVLVEGAMVPDVFTVAPDAPIAEVIETMIDRKLGSAVVMDGEQVVGVFTTVDALIALHELLEQDGDGDPRDAQ
jgi:acetoin utilization protein AcuB